MGAKLKFDDTKQKCIWSSQRIKQKVMRSIIYYKFICMPRHLSMALWWTHRSFAHEQTQLVPTHGIPNGWLRIPGPSHCVPKHLGWWIYQILEPGPDAKHDCLEWLLSISKSKASDGPIIYKQVHVWFQNHHRSRYWTKGPARVSYQAPSNSQRFPMLLPDLLSWQSTSGISQLVITLSQTLHVKLWVT